MLDFDPKEVPSEDVERLYEGGKYFTVSEICNLKVMVNSIEDITSQSNQRGIKITMQITDGENNGLLMTDSLYIAHDKEITRNIARRKLKSLYMACSVSNKIQSYSALYDKPIYARVKPKHYDGKNYNDFVFYSKEPKEIRGSTKAKTVSSVYTPDTKKDDDIPF